jgi:RimJ/RimL family protein N-acetyltransferase
MDGIERVETERLVGLRPAFRDADELHAVMADVRVARWLWPGELGGPRTLAQVRTILVRDADHWKRHRWGPWVVRDRVTHRMLGRVGLAHTHVAGLDGVELAWMLAPERWGQGLATEMAAEAVRAAFGPLGLSELLSFTQPHNTASRRVMERLGFVFDAEIEHAGLPHVLYRLRSPSAGSP